MRSISVCELGLARRASTATLVRSRCRVSRSAASTCASRRVQLGGELVFDQRLLVAFEPRRAAARAKMCSCEARSWARSSDAARVAVVRVRADGFRVFDDRAVVVLRLLRPLARVERRARRAPADAAAPSAAPATASAREAIQRPDEPALMTSAPRGILNAKRLIGQTDVFLEVGELERRAAALLVGGGQRPDLQRRAVDDQLQPVVVALAAASAGAAGPRCPAGAPSA